MYEKYSTRGVSQGKYSTRLCLMLYWPLDIPPSRASIHTHGGALTITYICVCVLYLLLGPLLFVYAQCIHYYLCPDLLCISFFLCYEKGVDLRVVQQWLNVLASYSCNVRSNCELLVAFCNTTYSWITVSRFISDMLYINI